MELINNPPTAGIDGTAEHEKFKGRDWRGISVGELVDERELGWVGIDDGVEEATNVCTSLSHPRSLTQTWTRVRDGPARLSKCTETSAVRIMCEDGG